MIQESYPGLAALLAAPPKSRRNTSLCRTSTQASTEAPFITATDGRQHSGPINWPRNKQNAVFPYNEILFSPKGMKY